MENYAPENCTPVVNYPPENYPPEKLPPGKLPPEKFPPPPPPQGKLPSSTRKNVPREVAVDIILHLFIFKFFSVTSFKRVSRTPAISITDPLVTLVNYIS